VGIASTTLRLYRPVGQIELDLIAESGYRRFPPRLSHQPIFYPVLGIEYATKIARDWNTKDPASGFAGFVTAFRVDGEFASRYEVHEAGGSEHRELWVPSEELEAFNEHIVGSIEVVAEYRGSASS